MKPWSIVGVAILGLLASAPHALSQVTPSEVVKSLEASDMVFGAGFRASITDHHMGWGGLQGPFYGMDTHWVLTFEGYRTGFLRDMIDFEKPFGIDVGKTFRVRSKKWGYWGNEVCGNHFVDSQYQLTSSGAIEKVSEIYTSSVYAPGDITPIANQRTFQWGLGRFFSDCLEEISEVDTLGGGRLKVVAVGRRYKGDLQGTWEFEIDPDSAWMVRKAKFSRGAKIWAEMVNTGKVWSGPFCIPESSKVNFFGPIEDFESAPRTYTHALEFESLVEGFDEDLYQQSKQAVLASEQTKLTVFDDTVSRTKITQPNLPVAGKIGPVAREDAL